MRRQRFKLDVYNHNLIICNSIVQIRQAYSMLRAVNHARADGRLAGPVLLGPDQSSSVLQYIIDLKDQDRYQDRTGGPGLSGPVLPSVRSRSQDRSCIGPGTGPYTTTNCSAPRHTTLNCTIVQCTTALPFCTMSCTTGTIAFHYSATWLGGARRGAVRSEREQLGVE